MYIIFRFKQTVCLNIFHGQRYAMTLKDIARVLGVSPSTVSRVISGTGNNFTVKPELRRQILDYVKECGYQPNQAYQAMRKKDNQQISIIMGNHWGTTSEASVTHAIQKLCNVLFDEGFSFHYLIRITEQFASYGLPQWKVAGAVAVDVRHPRVIEELNSSKIPYVVLNGVSGSRGNAVQSDEVFNMNLALEHLFELGHRKIVYVNAYRSPELMKIPYCESHYSVLKRAEAYFDFCRTHDLIPQETAGSCSFSNKEVVERGIASGATAYVTYSFESYMEVCHHLRQNGFDIPADVSVICFNNPISAFSVPPATCLDVPFTEMGLAAGRLLLEQIRDPRKSPVRLIIRESTASVPKNKK